ncbi:MAG: hypothetical protein RRC34_02765 [Lentisphaeria bacterium]|nr:hypothetical protein [Lentisphaeria bacterium]
MRISPLFRLVFAAIVAVSCLSAVPSAQANEARAAWMTGYQKLEEARQAEDDGRHEAATALYQSAKKIFTDVKTRYPDWNPTLLRYRIKFCDERIEALRASIESGVKTMSKNELLRLREEQQKKLDSLQSALRQKERDLTATSEALERARREAARNAAAREQTESLLREKQSLADQITLLSQKTERLEKDLLEARQDMRETRRADMLADRLTVAEAEKADLQEKLTALRTQVADLETRHSAAGAEREKLKTALINHEAALTRKEAELAAREKTVLELTRLIGEERARSAMANQRLESLSKQLEASQLENKTQTAARADLEKKLRQAEKSQNEGGPVDADTQKQMATLSQLVKAKDERVEALTLELKSVRDESDTLKQQLIRAQAMAETRTAEALRLDNQVKTLRADRTTHLARLDELQAKLTHLSQSQHGAAETVKRYEETITELRAEADRASRQADARLNLLRRQEQEIKTLGAEIDELTRKNRDLLDKPQPPTESPDVAALKQDLRNALTETEYHRQKAGEAKKDMQKALAQAQAYRQRADEAEKERLRLAASLEAVTDKTASAVSGQKALETRLTAELAVAKDRVAELEKELLAKSSAGGQTTEPPPPKDIAPVISKDTDPVTPEDTERVTALLHKGVQAEKDGNPEAAAWNYQRALEYDPGQVIALRRLGALSLANGDTTAAIIYLNRAFYVDPDNVDTLTQLGFAFMRNEQADMAFSMLSRAVALDADSAATHTQLGVACSSLGWREAAEVQFRRALKQNQTYAEAAFNLALLLGADKTGDRMDDARKWYQTARDNGAEADQALDQFFNYSPK